MKFSSTCIAAAAAFLPQLVSAHMRITDPMPYNGEDNAPLDPSGSNFPCMMPSGAYPSLSGSVKTYTSGQAGSFKITGGATHGGGSCQVSITYDNPPTKDSKFKVIQSWVGGCPTPSNSENMSDDRNDASIDPFSVMLPAGLKSGDATFVWTWFNRIGNREMYMNCAPIKIQGDGNDDSVFESLPDMFKANIGGGQCTTTEGQDIIFPDTNIGNNVVTGTGQCNFQPACKDSGSYSFKPGQSNGVSPPSPPSGGSGENQGDDQSSGSPGDEEARIPTPSSPALVDTGKGTNVPPNQPPSPSFTPINGGNDSGNDSGSSDGGNGNEGSGNEGGNEGGDNSDSPSQPPPPSTPTMPSPPSGGNYDNGSGNSSAPPSTGGDTTGNGSQDDNTGRMYGAKCVSGTPPVICDGAPSGTFIECYGPGMGWTHQIPGGYDSCEDFAAKSGHGKPAKQRFRRHAFEHAKRFRRRHLHI